MSYIQDTSSCLAEEIGGSGLEDNDIVFLVSFCRYRRALSIDCLLAKMGVDTDESGPCKVWNRKYRIRYLLDVLKS